MTGIDMPQAPMQALRAALEAALHRIGGDADAGDARPRVVVFGCLPEHGGVDISAPGRPKREYRSAEREYRSAEREGAPVSGLDDARTATLPLLCAAQLPPSFIEYALRAGADGVIVTGCRDGDCAFRLGNRWAGDRIAGQREPHLRSHVPRDRVRVAWVGRGDTRALAAALDSLRDELGAMAAQRPPAGLPPKRAQRDRSPSHSQ